MAKIVVYLALLVAIVVYVQAQAGRRCPPNQVWDSCGTACPLTCENPQPPQICTKECKIGCKCKAGYLLDGSNCVRPSDC